MAFWNRVKLFVGVEDAVADSTTPYSLIAAGTTNATLVKAGLTGLTSIHAINVNAAVRYLKLYDTARTPTAGVGTPVRRYAIPASATGAGFVLALSVPMRFNAGLGFTLTTGVLDTDATALTASDVVLTLEYV